MPPVTTKLASVTFEGDPGGEAPPENPLAMIVPIGVPSLFKISKANLELPHSAQRQRLHGREGAGTRKNVRPHARMNSHHRLAVDGLNVGDADLLIKVFGRPSMAWACRDQSQIWKCRRANS